MTGREGTSRQDTPVVDAAEEDPDVDKISEQGRAEASARDERPS